MKLWGNILQMGIPLSLKKWEYLTMSNEPEKFLEISDTVRKVALDYGKRIKWPKAMITRATEGALDDSPLMQAFAQLEEELDIAHSLEIQTLNNRISELSQFEGAFREERAYNSMYKDKIKAIIKRAKGSFFGKSKDIVSIAQKAIDEVEGPYH